MEDRTLLSAWPTFGHDAQHSGLAQVPSQPLTAIRWQAPLDLNPPAGGIAIHYGSPLVTQANTAILPVKTADPAGRFRVEARNGSNGAVQWTLPTDYRLPPHQGVPSYSPTLTATNRLFFPGAGGSVFVTDTPDAFSTPAVRRLAFYGNYDPNYDDRVFINTPLTADPAGNVYFGFQVTGPTAQDLESGVARLQPNGFGTWMSARQVTFDPTIRKVVHNSAPALSHDGTVLYAAVTSSDGTGAGRGYLLALNSVTLELVNMTGLVEPLAPDIEVLLSENGSASPVVGPDGDVYLGVLENPYGTNHGRGWLLHFDAWLTETKLPGAFGWDTTPSIVPRDLVPSYQGPSDYLLLTKYNDYWQLGGEGQNQLALLDPNDMFADPVTGACVMAEVLTIVGPTPDPGFPGAVKEWCINAAAVDPFTGSVLANNEDGRLYRWDLATNTFTQVITLSAPIGAAYTPTVVGPDGTVYAIHNAVLFAVRGGFAPGGQPSAGAAGEDLPQARQGPWDQAFIWNPVPGHAAWMGPLVPERSQDSVVIDLTGTAPAFPDAETARIHALPSSSRHRHIPFEDASGMLVMLSPPRDGQGPSQCRTGRLRPTSDNRAALPELARQFGSGEEHRR